MPDVFVPDAFAGAQMLPVGYCLQWRADLVWMHVLSDLCLAMVYFAIPVIVFAVLRERGIPSSCRWVFRLFGAAIVMGGFVHILNMLSMWHDVHNIEAVAKVLTAALSVAAVLLLIPAITVLSMGGDKGDISAIFVRQKEKNRAASEGAAAVDKETARHTARTGGKA